LAVFAQSTASFYKNIIITLVIEKNGNFFRRKMSKIAENCDHNIDPRLAGIGNFYFNVELSAEKYFKFQIWQIFKNKNRNIKKSFHNTQFQFENCSSRACAEFL
jgi:hypothetical protein